MRWRYFIPIIVSLVISFGCAQQVTEPSPLSGKARQLIEIKAADQILNHHYQAFWAEEEFSELLADKAGFKNDFIAKFNKNLAKHNLETQNFEFSFDQTSHSTVAKCKIYGAISKSGNNYRARFEWFLNPLGLDFINNDFKKSQRVLSWEGDIGGISTTINLEFPSPINHCHAHVWWELSP